MKKRIISLILTLCMLVGMLNSFSISVYSASNIEVYIDEEKISFDVAPEIINGRTMVPMRKIFEYLGADVEWYQYNQSIEATCGYLDIEMQINNNKMYVNDDCIKLDSPPIIKEGRTLVPLRAVAEAFSSKVDWIDKTKTVKITTPYPKNKYVYKEEFDKYHIRTSNCDYEYFDLQIKDEMLTITGCIRDKDVYMVAIKFDDGKLDKKTSVSVGKVFDLSVDLSEKNISDETNIRIYTKKQGDDLYQSYMRKNVFIEKNKKEYSFKKPLAWNSNEKYMSNWTNPIAYIKLDIDDEIIDLSNDICKNAEDDYKKVLMIHDWVADNIYYDYDYYNNKDSATVERDAVGVYKCKRSVCGGYTNLTQELINAQGIPCRKVSGYALGVSSTLKYWTEETVSEESTNHAWNQAYVNNRWINLDTTWSSGNKYKDGEFLYAGLDNHLYFDISDVFLSYSHKCIR